MADYSLNAAIVGRKDLTNDLAIIQVAPLAGERPPFVPGQYAELAVPDPEVLAAIEAGTPLTSKVVRRSYSIASAPSEKNFLEFYLVLVPGGIVTPRLWPLHVGDRLWLGPKIKGKFTLEGLPTDKDLVMISTGTGISPFISMVREYAGQKRWRRVVVIQGARYSQDLGYREELEALAAKHSDIIYIPLVTREPEDSPWNGLRGRVQTALDPNVYRELVGADLSPAECQMLLCGNPDMIDTVQAELETRGFKLHSKKNPGNIHFERFW